MRQSIFAAILAALSSTAAIADDTIETITVTAKRLDEARSGIQTQTGASVFNFDQQQIQALPGADNTLLNQVFLQAPEVAQDSFGQFHVRGEHANMQFRLNGTILPEGLSNFGQVLDPRLIESMKFITGALPAEYGLRTAAIADMTTKSGLFDSGGTLSYYGGSHETIEPSINYGGSSGSINYYVSGDFLQNKLGIESPDGRSDPLHDRTTQYHGFGYFEDILDASNRINLILGAADEKFQIPDLANATPLGLTVNGISTYPSTQLDEWQREITYFGILGLQHNDGPFDLTAAFSMRYSSLRYDPDILGDLLFDGISQVADKHDLAYGLQSDAAYHLGDSHTLRAGFYVQTDHASSDTTSLTMPTDTFGNQIGDAPIAIIQNGAQTQWMESAYLQDEWQIFPSLTINYGLRFDRFDAYSSGDQLSPRVNLVWKPIGGTTLHAGYSRYYTPPPFELVGSETTNQFVNTTAAPALLTNDTPKAERANYYDVGIEQKAWNWLTIGLDGYYKISRNLIDEGQFGAPIILTPFNYRYGKQYGLELTSAVDAGPVQIYGNAALQHAIGKQIVSAEFNFSPDDLAYIENHFIDLDHEQHFTASGGISYTWQGTKGSVDFLYGSGLRATPDGGSPNSAHLPYYLQVNLGLSHAFDLTERGPTTLRFDVINLLDKTYEIRDGTGIGVGAPQFGPRRGFFLGVSQAF